MPSIRARILAVRPSRFARAGLLACMLAFAGSGPALANGPTTVTRGHFAYDLDDPSVGSVHFVCDEIRRVVNGKISESIHCKTTDTSKPSAVIFSPTHLFGGYPWFSDFTGDEAIDFHLVGTPSGNLDGWATY